MNDPKLIRFKEMMTVSLQSIFSAPYSSRFRSLKCTNGLRDIKILRCTSPSLLILKSAPVDVLGSGESFVSIRLTIL
jgi:hypothetical protein